MVTEEAGMDISKLEIPVLDDTTLAEKAPAIRALVAQRLEQIWQACLPHIDGDIPNPSAPMVELGLRATRELSRLFRLDAPAHGDPAAVTGTNIGVRELVAGHLAVLEARMRGEDTP
jgi:hypothetical protein